MQKIIKKYGEGDIGEVKKLYPCVKVDSVKFL